MLSLTQTLFGAEDLRWNPREEEHHQQGSGYAQPPHQNLHAREYQLYLFLHPGSILQCFLPLW